MRSETERWKKGNNKKTWKINHQNDGKRQISVNIMHI